jgi:membrane associated rhomboid family serine protease
MVRAPQGDDVRPSALDAESVVGEARRALFVMAGVIAVIWIVQVVNWLDGYGLSRRFGIIAHEPSRLGDIFAAPFLHWSFTHIEANSAPLFFLGFLAAYRGLRRFVVVTLLIVVMSGLGSWLFGSPHAVGTGASGVVYGYFAYVVLRGVVERHLVDVIVGLVVALSYWSIVAGVLPSDRRISWQAHLFGLLAGIVAAVAMRSPSKGAIAVAPHGSPDAPAVTVGPAAGPAPGAGSRAALHKELDDLGLS